MSLKASLKSVIAEMDSFGADEKGASPPSVLAAHTERVRVAETEGNAL